MKTKLETIAAFVAASIWADGFYDEAEKELLAEVAEAIDVDEKKWIAIAEAEIKKVEKMSDDEINNYMEKAAKNVDSSEVNEIFEICLEMMLSDLELSKDEVTNLLAFAELLHIETENAVLMIADMVKDEEEMVVEL